MSIRSAMSAGMTGLHAHSTSITVTGDNVANINTVGYRGSRAIFEDLLTRKITGIGQLTGTRLATIDKIFRQAAITPSSRATDMAINGRGFFCLKGNHDGLDGSFYSRAGAFNVDNEGYLVNPQGLNLQGYMADTDGNIATNLSDIKLGPEDLPPAATSEINVSTNLDATEQTVVAAFDPADPQATSNYSTSITVMDSVGNQHEVTMYFRKSGTNTWEWHALTEGAEVAGGVPGVPEEIGTGSLVFTADGLLDQENITLNSVDFVGAAAGQTISYDFGESITTDGGDGLSATTAFAAPSVVKMISQNGFSAGELVDVAVDGGGAIMGVYSNGQRRTLAQVAVADFLNQQGLERIGGTLFIDTIDTGEALIGLARTGGRGGIRGQSLEQSNVDLAEEFVSLISAQRGYQASGKTITTSDELFVETINLKR